MDLNQIDLQSEMKGKKRLFFQAFSLLLPVGMFVSLPECIYKQNRDTQIAESSEVALRLS